MLPTSEAAWYSELMRHMGAAAAQQQQAQQQMDPAAAWYYHYTQSTVADSVLKAAAMYQTQQGVSPFWGRPLGGGRPAVSLHGGHKQTLAGACQSGCMFTKIVPSHIAGASWNIQHHWMACPRRDLKRVG